MPADKSVAHTRGPWTVDDTYLEVGAIVGADGFPVADVHDVAILQGYDEKLGLKHWSGHEGTAYITRPDAEVLANARLIAVAPTMYEALRLAVASLEAVQVAALNGRALSETELIFAAEAANHARAAIRKATGAA